MAAALIDTGAIPITAPASTIATNMKKDDALRVCRYITLGYSPWRIVELLEVEIEEVLRLRSRYGWKGPTANENDHSTCSDGTRCTHRSRSG